MSLSLLSRLSCSFLCCCSLSSRSFCQTLLASFLSVSVSRSCLRVSLSWFVREDSVWLWLSCWDWENTNWGLMLKTDCVVCSVAREWCCWALYLCVLQFKTTQLTHDDMCLRLFYSSQSFSLVSVDSSRFSREQYRWTQNKLSLLDSNATNQRNTALHGTCLILGKHFNPIKSLLTKRKGKKKNFKVNTNNWTNSSFLLF